MHEHRTPCPPRFDLAGTNGSLLREPALVRTIGPTKESVPPEPNPTPPAINVGDRVTVEKLYDDRGKMVVRLDERENAPDKGKISVATPLGAALLDAEEGEEVEFLIGSHIRSVRVLSIERQVR